MEFIGTLVSFGERSKVFIVDGHPMARLGLKTFFTIANDIRVVGESDGKGYVVDSIESARPDLVVLGLNLPGEMDGVEFCQAIKCLPDPPRVLVHTAYNFPEDLASCFLAGADGFVHKSVDEQTMLDAVRHTSAGRGPWVPEGTIGEPRSQFENTPQGFGLTPRERQILGLMLHRYSYGEISETLYISIQTVKNHVSKILRKFGVKTRKELLSKASLTTMQS